MLGLWKTKVWSKIARFGKPSGDGSDRYEMAATLLFVDEEAKRKITNRAPLRQQRGGRESIC
jgi:hypothetical protein